MSRIPAINYSQLVECGVLMPSDLRNTLPELDNYNCMPARAMANMPIRDEFVSKHGSLKKNFDWKFWGLIGVAAASVIGIGYALRQPAVLAKLNPINWAKGGWEHTCNGFKWCKDGIVNLFKSKPTP